MKIVVLDGYTLNPGDLSWTELEKLGECTCYDRTPPENIVERISDAAIAFTNKTPLTRDILQQCPALRYVGVLATGYNVVDVAAAKEQGIIVTNIPTYGTSAVAQYVFALLLEICHHVGAHYEAVQAGEWAQRGDFSFWNYPLIELKDKTMGIIGFGRIGQVTAQIANAFGMKVLAYDNYRKKELETDVLRYAELDEIYACADVISLHCPLFDSTRGMINKASLAKMKPGVIIINTSRGPLIVEEDLAEALANGQVFAAALDVVATEPIEADSPLLSAPNCIITPHIAWAPKESRERLLGIAVDNLSAFLAGSPVNVVNS
ncbi:D-2-hydroxyacid dehydrogenase [Propionispora vibrioides]|uniref:Glycerate dehydrogenase n=1 Tax=Propionispora vibrioides TaxID=112903 RepID=A0A1H8Y0H1_9FIRM|nr:D-2-hydroxyacid dehydrogenase [Propionispora vibrioides]SEP45774.1 glycerate dehydrogenase [Propionispora vibrioides]